MAKILLADDSGHAQRMGTKILSAEGHEVATVSNGQAALKMLSGFNPDLIVADVFMPGRTGYELCQFIKADPKLSWIPVLLMVGKMEPYDPVEGQRVHADGVVTKPLESSDLVAIVQQLLASAKKPAPPPPAKAPAAEPVSVMKPDAPVEEDMATPITTPVELEIPEEIRQQPISLFGELLEPQVASTPPLAERPAEEWVTGLTPVEAAPLETAFEEQLEETPLAPLALGVEAEPAEVEQPLFAAGSPWEREESYDSPMLSPTIPAEELSSAIPALWTAESAVVTEEDRKLFEPPPPDWQGLMSMVEEEEKQGQSPSVSAGGVGIGAQPDARAALEPTVASAPMAETRLPSADQLSPQSVESSGITASGAVERMVPISPEEERVALPSESSEMLAPRIAPLDYATIEQIVRETVEEMMPQIVDRIAQATGITFRKKG